MGPTLIYVHVVFSLSTGCTHVHVQICFNPSGDLYTATTDTTDITVVPQSAPNEPQLQGERAPVAFLPYQDNYSILGWLLVL